MIGDSANVTLAYRMQQGEKLKYRTTVNTQQTIEEKDKPPQLAESQLEMVMSQTCREISPEGHMTVDVLIESGSIRQDQQVSPLPSAGQTITMVMKNSGEVLRSSVDFPFSQPAFPEKPVAISDTWNSDSQMQIPLYGDDGEQSGVKDLTLTYIYKLMQLSLENGYNVAVIDVQCPAKKVELQPGASQTIEAHGRTYFSHDKGRLVKSEVNTTTLIEAEGAQVLTKITVEVELTESSSGSGGGGGGIGGSPDEAFIIS